MIAQQIQELDELALAMQAGGMSRRLAIRQVIEEVEDRMQSMDHFGKHPFPLTHEFADGVYKRQIFVPASMLVVGMIHKQAHFCVIPVGECSVLTEDGPIRFKGPHIFRSPKGSKRIVYHHTDTLWLTFHALKQMPIDLEKIDEALIADSYQEAA